MSDTLALPIEGERLRLERAPDGIVIVRLADGEVVGRFTVEASQPGQLFVRTLCIEEKHRSYGAGSEAALLFNRACDAAGIGLIRAWAPPDRGLAVYFWIRMGFSPVHGEGPEGGISFERRR